MTIQNKTGDMAMEQQYSKTVETAREYYNSDDADTFYYNIWGGEDIHIGLYKSEDEPIFDASQRTVKRMASFADKLEEKEHPRVIDLGAGYGGAARFLAREYDCEVVALNLSEVENERDRQMNRAQGLDDQITVVDGNFENIDEPDNSFDVVWSQDSFLHSGQRGQIFSEVKRILKEDGDFVFTDPMQKGDTPKEVLQPILDRIHLESLGSPAFYREKAEELGLEEVRFDEQTDKLTLHYARVLEETQKHEDKLEGKISRDYIDHMKEGLRHWVDGGENGRLVWGIFHFKN